MKTIKVNQLNEKHIVKKYDDIVLYCIQLDKENGLNSSCDLYMFDPVNREELKFDSTHTDSVKAIKIAEKRLNEIMNKL